MRKVSMPYMTARLSLENMRLMERTPTKMVDISVRSPTITRRANQLAATIMENPTSQAHSGDPIIPEITAGMCGSRARPVHLRMTNARAVVEGIQM